MEGGKNKSEQTFTSMTKELFLPFVPITGLEINFAKALLFIDNVIWNHEFSSFEIFTFEEDLDSLELYEIKVQEALDFGWEIMESSKEDKSTRTLN